MAIGRCQPARGDGAFPSSQSVLLPRDRPREIILGATFGLIFTDDDGASWRYACETAMTTLGRNYVIGPPPANRIYGVSAEGAPVTADGACTWALGGGALVEPGAEAATFDVFPDRSNHLRVYALAIPWDLVDPVASVYRSSDAGLTYVGPLFTPPAQSTSTGVEAAFLEPQVVYVTWYERSGFRPHLARSADGGDTWTSIDIQAGIGAAMPYLVAVDPTDARRVTLRVISDPDADQPFEAIAITEDAGLTWSLPLSLPGGKLAGFARRADGVLFVVGAVDNVSQLFRSNDGGRTFAGTPLPFQAGGLGERDGTLFIPTNNFVDGFALTSSHDDGQTWRPRLRFSDIAGIKGCVSSSCRADCNYLASLTLFPDKTCVPIPDAGSPDAASPDARDGRPGGGGCGCRLGSVVAAGSAGSDLRAGFVAAVVGLAVGLLARRRPR